MWRECWPGEGGSGMMMSRPARPFRGHLMPRVAHRHLRLEPLEDRSLPAVPDPFGGGVVEPPTSAGPTAASTSSADPTVTDQTTSTQGGLADPGSGTSDPDGSDSSAGGQPAGAA